MLREMTAPAGGFYSTQDADSEGHEGKFFVWSPQEIEALLEPQTAAIFCDYYGVSARGNFEGMNILSVVRSVESVAQRFKVSEAAVNEALDTGRAILFDRRETRIKPGRDEKILTEWNGLMIHALAECGVVLDHPAALDAAVRAADFILANMSQPDGRLFRSFKDGQARFNAYLEDYAAFMRGLIALYEATFDLRWLGEATRLAQLMFAQFHDAGGGFFQTGIDHEELVARRKDFVDNAIPAGNSLAAESLLRLAVLLDKPEYRSEAGRILLMMKDAMARQPTGFGRLLGVLDAYLAPSQEIAVVGDADAFATRPARRAGAPSCRTPCSPPPRPAPRARCRYSRAAPWSTASPPPTSARTTPASSPSPRRKPCAPCWSRSTKEATTKTPGTQRGTKKERRRFSSQSSLCPLSLLGEALLFLPSSCLFAPCASRR